MSAFWTRMVVIALLSGLGVAGCDTPMEYEDGWLDSPSVEDPALNDRGYLLSTRPGLTPDDLSRPVVIAVHGFTASTFEWREFREYAESTSPVLVSLVLLGGHGRSVEQFRESTWRDWGQPILDEFEALRVQGYTNITLAGSSTGAALILEQLSRDRYTVTGAPRHFLFIDPIVVSTDKMLTLIPLLKHLVSHTTSDATEEERPHFYSIRPAAALAQLNDLIGRLRNRLEGGIRLPTMANAKVYKTARDATADPVSALLIYRGLERADGGAIDVEMLDSDLHVFTRLSGRNPAMVTSADRELQARVFREIVARISN